MAVKPIPDGYHSVTPYLVVRGASALIEFLERAFGATVLHRMAGPDGSVRHAEVRIGDSPVMLAEAREAYPAVPAMLYLYVEDTDAVYASALEAGAESLMTPADQFYGDRNAGVKDPSGNSWWIATRVEDVSAEEIARRGAAAQQAAATA